MVHMDNLQKATELRALHQAFIPIVHRLGDMKEKDLYDDAMSVLQKIYHRAGKYEEDVLQTVRPRRAQRARKKQMRANFYSGVMPKKKATSLGENIVGRATRRLVK